VDARMLGVWSLSRLRSHAPRSAMHAIAAF